MEKLLEMAGNVADKAEVYSNQYTRSSVNFENARLHDIDTKFQSGVALRVIKDGRAGFAYTKNLINPQELLQNALDSLKGGVEADYDLPLTRGLPQLDTYNPSLENLSTADMVEESARVCHALSSKTDGEVKAICLSHMEEIHIMNTEGMDVSAKSTYYVIYCRVSYPGTASGIVRSFYKKGFERTPDSLISEIIDLYRLSSKVVQPRGGEMRAMFMPNSMITLSWRITSGTSSKSVYEHNSPLAAKLGKKVFDEKISIYDDPLNDSFPGARAFDDEGVACSPLTIVENGVLRNFFSDLHYAKKLKAKPTGHGYKVSRWGGETITFKPKPALNHMSISPGDRSFSQLVKAMDKGVIIEGALGAHSGNIPNGDYSIGVSPGLWVEKGEIVGRVKDAMVAGNIYETFKHVVDIGDTLYPSYGGWMPPVLFDNVCVATRS